MRGFGGTALAGAFVLLIAATGALAQPVMRSLDDGTGSLVVAQGGTQARAIQGVNIRTGPGGQFPVVGILRGSELVGLAGCSPHWCQLGDGRGWVSRQYLAIGGEPATVASIPRGTNQVVIETPAPPAHFTGAWYVQPSVPAPEVVERVGGVDFRSGNIYGPPDPPPPPPPPLPPFRLLIAQAGDHVEGIAGASRMEGTVASGGREARITLTTLEGERFDGLLVVEGGQLTAVIRSLEGGTISWRATRTVLTR